MATFFCFLRTITELYSEEVDSNNENRLPDIPPSMFYDTSISYFEMERVGGLASYLYKAHHREVAQALSIPDYITPAATTADPAHSNRGNNPIHHNATPMPSAPNLHFLEVVDQPEEESRSSAVLDPSPGITIAVPRIQAIPLELEPSDGGNAGILSTNTGNATTQTSQAPNRERSSIMPPPPPPPRQTPVAPAPAPTTERDDNNGANLSATSSGEDIPPPLPVPHLGAALLAGTPR